MTTLHKKVKPQVFNKRSNLLKLKELFEAGDHSQNQLAEQFNVSKGTISKQIKKHGFIKATL